MTAIATPTASAEATLERDYDRLKPEVVATVRRRLAASGVHLDDADLDEFYNQAWHALYLKLADGETVDNRAGLLVTITHRRALDEYRALSPGRRSDPEELDAQAFEPDVTRALDDRDRLRHLIEGLHERLGERELQAAVLCYVHEYSRDEAARVLAIRPRRMKKVMDEVSRTVTGLVGDLRADDWCESRASLIKAYALGLLDPDGKRHALAAEHLRDCPACRQRVLALRGLTAVTPPAPLLLGALAASGVGVGRGARHAARRVGSKTTMAAGAGAVVAAAAALAATGAFDSPPPADHPAAVRGGAVPTATPAATPRPVKKPKPHHARPHRRTRAGKAPTPAATPVPAAVATPAPTPVPTAPPAATAAPPPRQPPLHDGWQEFELG